MHIIKHFESILHFYNKISPFEYILHKIVYLHITLLFVPFILHMYNISTLLHLLNTFCTKLSIRTIDVVL